MTSTKNTNVNMIVDIGFALILALPIAITGGKIMTTSGNTLESTAKRGADVNQNLPQECIVDNKGKRVERINISTEDVLETYRYMNT